MLELKQTCHLWWPFSSLAIFLMASKRILHRNNNNNKNNNNNNNNNNNINNNTFSQDTHKRRLLCKQFQVEEKMSSTWPRFPDYLSISSGYVFWRRWYKKAPTPIFTHHTYLTMLTNTWRSNNLAYKDSKNIWILLQTTCVLLVSAFSTKN